MSSITIKETGSNIVLRAMRHDDGSITMDIGLDDPVEISKIISLDEKQIADLREFLTNHEN